MFDRIAKWLLPLLIIIEAALVWTGVLDLAEAVGVIIGIEVLLALVAARQILTAMRRFRQGRDAGLDAWAALEDGLAVLLPRKVARVAAQEPRLWACLAQWALRRRPRQGEFTYHRRSAVGPLLLAVVFTTPVEVLLFELLIPWSWLRWVLLVAAIYLLFWAFGFYASLVVLPHRLEHSGLRLHYGTFADGYIPYGAIAIADLERRRSPGGGDGLKVARQENAAYLSEHLKGVTRPEEPPEPGAHVWHQYVVRVPAGRDALAAWLRQRGIETAIYYPTPIPDQPLYRDLGYEAEVPVARRLALEVLALPVHPGLSEADLETIVSAVNEWADTRVEADVSRG